jgi:hypothetical protein
MLYPLPPIRGNVSRSKGFVPIRSANYSTKVTLIPCDVETIAKLLPVPSVLPPFFQGLFSGEYERPDAFLCSRPMCSIRFFFDPRNEYWNFNTS